MQKVLICCISDESWATLRDLAGIPHVHRRQNARGLSSWVVNLITNNPPSSWHDCRPDWLKQAEEEEYKPSIHAKHQKNANDRFWALPKGLRMQRRLLLPVSILPELYPIASNLNLFPKSFSPAAILGLLLEVLGSGWLTIDHIPELQTDITLRQARLKSYSRDDQDSLLRVERHTSSWQTSSQN